MEPSVGTHDDIPQGSRSQSEIGAIISTILSGGSICDHSGRESTSLNKPSEGVGERDCEDKEVARVYVDVLIDTVRRMSLLPSDMLAMKFRLQRNDEQQRVDTTRAAIFSSQPLNVLAKTRWFTAFNVIFGCTCIFFLATSSLGGQNAIDSILKGGVWTGYVNQGIEEQTFMLQIRDGRNCSSFGNQGPIPGFGLVERPRSMVSRCHRRKLPILARDPLDCSRFTLTYEAGHAPDSISGFFVVQPANESLTSSGGGKTEYSFAQKVDGSWGKQHTVVHSGSSGSSNTTNKLEFTLTIGWPAWMALLTVWLCLALMSLAWIICYFTNTTRLAHTIYVVTLFCISIGYLASYVGHMILLDHGAISFHDGDWVRLISSRFGIIYFVAGFLHMQMPRFPDILISLQMLVLAFFLADGSWVDQDGNPDRNRQDVYFAGSQVATLVCLAISFVLVIYRLQVWFKGESLARRIIGTCDELWKSKVITSSPSQLAKLESIVADLEKAIPSGTSCRQVNLKVDLSVPETSSGTQRRRLSFFTDSKGPDRQDLLSDASKGPVDPGKGITDILMGDGWMPSKTELSTKSIESSIDRMPFENLVASVSSSKCRFILDNSSPVTSLDQLWTQAIMLRGFLLPKVLDLADRFGGIFPLRIREGKFERCPSRVWMPYKGRLRMRGIKSPQRGIEKVDSAYGGDVSRLLDVCGERIIFRSIENMADCLEALKKDPEVEIVRVKSSMTKSGLSPFVRTGFRFISVNLRIKNPQTTRLAVCAHICEVQFVLKSFAELVTPAAHDEYISIRNAISVFDMSMVPASKTMTYSARRALGRITARTASFITGLRGRLDRRNAVAPEILEQESWSPLQAATAQTSGNDGIGGSGFHLEGQILTSWGVSLNKSDVHLLESVCRLGGLGLTTYLDRTAKKKTNSSGLGKAWLTSMMFTPNAVVIIADHFVIQMLLVSGGLIFIFSDIQRFIFWQTLQVESFHHFKFTSLADRLGGRVPSTPGVNAFGVLSDLQGNCHRFDAAAETSEQFKHKYDLVPHTVFRDGPSITVSFADKVPFTGWYLESPEGGANTSNFAVYASNHDVAGSGDAEAASNGIPLDAWKLVGTPSWGSGIYGNPTVDPATSTRIFDMPGDREVTLFEPTAFTAYYYMPRPWIGYGFGSILPVIAARLRKMTWVKPAMLFGIFLGLYCELVAVATAHRSSAGNDDTALVAVQVLTMLGTFSLMIGVLIEGFKSAWPMMISLHICAIFRLFAYVVMVGMRQRVGGVALYGFRIFSSARNGLPLFPMAIWTMMIVTKLSRIIGVRQARKLISEDMKTYDELWKQEVDKDADHASLNHLARVVQMLGLDDLDPRGAVSRNSLRQIGRKFLILDVALAPKTKRTNIAPRLTREKCLGDDVIFELLNCMSVPYSIDKNNKVRSCDQLYVQAMLVHNTLREKIKDWAQQSQGYVAILPDPLSQIDGNHFVKWADAQNDPAMVRRVKWPLLKKSARVMEKLRRVYNGNAGRLADIARFSLFFDTFTDLTQALGCIVTDFDVKVERVKSRLSLKHDGDATAGYRDVMLNLRVCTKKTAMLGCDTHLCEVQLVLKSFGALKTAQGHQRYVMFRDLRGE